MKKYLLVFVCLSLASCSSTKGWVYKENNYDKSSYSNNSSLSNKTIAVLPFSDKRSNENVNASLLYLIPLFPFGYQNLSSPETVPIHANSGLWVNFDPKKDFAEALSEELNSLKVFKEAYFSNSIGNSDYYISGSVVSTDYNSKLFSYGLSVYGPALWLIGLPATHISNDLEIKLSLMDSKSQKVLFTKRYKANHYSKVGWIYSLPNDFYYPEMLRTLYGYFIEDLSNNIGKLQ